MNNSEITEVKSIVCSWVPIKNDASDETKSGRYSNSMYWEIDGFGRTKWVVLGYLNIDWVKEMEVSGRSQESIIKGCLKHLNILPERKPYQKKDPKPIYGNLDLFRASFKVKDNKPFIIAELTTDEQRNENFWSEGPCPVSHSSPKQKRSEKILEPQQQQEMEQTNDF